MIKCNEVMTGHDWAWTGLASPPVVSSRSHCIIMSQAMAEITPRGRLLDDGKTKVAKTLASLVPGEVGLRFTRCMHRTDVGRKGWEEDLVSALHRHAARRQKTLSRSGHRASIGNNPNHSPVLPVLHSKYAYSGQRVSPSIRMACLQRLNT